MNPILVWNNPFIYVLRRNKTAQRKRETGSKEAEYFMGFIISLEKHKSEKHHPHLENRKAV